MFQIIYLVETLKETGNFTSFLARNITFKERCPKLDIRMKIAIKYLTKDVSRQSDSLTAEYIGSQSLFFSFKNQTLEKEIPLVDPSFIRVCDNETKINSLYVQLKNGWEMALVYSVALNDSKIYRLSRASLHYTIDEKTFEDASPLALGSHYASTPAGFSAYSTTIDSSYKCSKITSIPLDNNARLEVSYYHGQPFVTKDTFDTGLSSTL